MPNGEVLDRNGNVVGYIDANGKIHYTLPQTGENQSEGVAAAALGGAVVCWFGRCEETSHELNQHLRYLFPI